MPVGVPGELFIGGEGLARGYLNQPELTAERFIANLFRPDSSARLYRTGDCVRYRPDGCLEYLGRLDHQVKIRGYRIELGEVEAMLLRHPSVREAVVLRGKTSQATNTWRPTQWPVAVTATLPLDLRAFLKQRLPEYMIPGVFVVLDALPLTPNGKVDRKALPKPDFCAGTSARFEPPRTQLQREVAAVWQGLLKGSQRLILEIWRDLLDIPDIGLDDNFFELGGHSLLGTRMLSRIRHQLGVTLPLRTLFEAATVRTLAERVDTLVWAVSGASSAEEGEENRTRGNRTMSYEAILSELRVRQIRLWEDGGRLRCSAPKGAMTLELKQAISNHKSELLGLLKGAIPGVRDPVRRVARAATMPLSFAQQRLWFLEQLEGELVAYNMPFAVRLWGRLDAESLRRALETILQRHEALRTTFRLQDGEPLQVIRAPSRFDLPLVVLGDLPREQREAALRTEARRGLASV